MAGNKRWSEKEIQYLRKHYQGTDIDDILRVLTNRSKASIHKKASDLGISFKWNEKNEILVLLQDIIIRLEKLELSLNNRKKRQTIWTDEDVEIIKKNYQELSDYNIAQLLSNGSNRATVQIKRSSLGLTKKLGKKRIYDTEKENYIIEHYPKKRAKELATALDLTMPEINRYLRKLRREKKLGFIHKKQ